MESALSQSNRFDEIIVVDDASSDNSAAIVSELCERDTTLKLVQHETNAGQLAAFETAIMRSTGDILFFLDADDVYSTGYVATALDVYRKFPRCDFLFSRNVQFSNEMPFSDISALPADGILPLVADMGLTLVRTLERRIFIGAPTSCISMRHWLAKRLFPLPLHEDWRTRADDCLVFGASLAGARKFQIEAPLVAYRIHGLNAFAQNPKIADPGKLFLRQLALARLFRLLRQRFSLDRDVNALAHLEFKTIPDPSLALLCEYVGYVLKNGAKDAGRLRAIALMVKWYLKSKNTGGS